MKNIVWIIIVIALGIFVFNKYQKENKWSLMVCKSKTANGVECFESSYIVPGFNSAKDCLLTGINKFSKQGFECGRNCKSRSSGLLDVCSEICNKAGCSK